MQNVGLKQASPLSIPPRAEVWAVAELARGADAPLIVVAENDRQLEALAACLSFFIIDKEVLTFPAWDALPYDRNSPNAAIVSERLRVLSQLSQAENFSGILLTTASAVTQKLMPIEAARGSRFTLQSGGRINHAALMQFLQAAGYHRASKAMESGEYAVRGSVVDIVPSGSEVGIRLDLFGDEIESMREFDPMSQRSLGETKPITLTAASEVLVNDETIERFRTQFRDAFGAQQGRSVVYDAVSSGARVAGMEFFLPLFYEHTHTLKDYLPNARIVLLPMVSQTLADRAEQIAEYYDARLEADRNKAKEPYFPLPPERLYDVSVTQHALVMDSFQMGAGTLPDFNNPYDRLRGHDKPILLAAHSKGSADRLMHALHEQGIAATHITHAEALESVDAGVVAVAPLPLTYGFSVEAFTAITEGELLGVRIAQRGKPKRKTDVFMQESAMFLPGELVVHDEHGIGRFEALETLTVLGASHDCLKLMYDGGDKLYVPVENMDVISHFGAEDDDVPLDKLGAAQWQMRKAKMKERIRLAAQALIQLAAERAVKPAEELRVEPAALEEFARGFGYAETDDQARAIDDVIADLRAGKPMDRLVCGDVGFGKTEVALRAAFAAVQAGMQVALIVPTSLLSRQHTAQFEKRFSGFPYRIAQLSRLVNAANQKKTKEGLKNGTIDIVVGTHALLAKDVQFKRLGLVIVDEEQHFGVKQKERLKELKHDVHVLTLTATPIPRTLQLALSGVRDLSLITTPPVDRLAVRSFVMPLDPVILREALMREKHRGGRSFIVTPRIADMADLRAQIAEIVPELTLAQAHGQMAATELEDIMTKFVDGEVDILIATNIIESGIDVQAANTIIINRADRFGLGQLYQLRGRVGRSKQRAYAYFLIPSYTITRQAVRRLEVMQTLDRLGAGFSLASHDMDIRGCGNLVGEEQSGHIREVGVELYQHMLEEAIAEMKQTTGHRPPTTDFSPQINLGLSVLIPETYVPDLELRLGLYKRAASLKDKEEIEAFHAELIDRFGDVPVEVQHLLATMELKQLCKQAAVAKLDVGPKGAVIQFKHEAVSNPEALLKFISKHPTRMKMRPDQSLAYSEDFSKKEAAIPKLRALLAQLALDKNP